MNHPVLKNIRSIAIYSLIWFLISAFEFSFLVFTYKLDIESSLYSSLIFNFVFASLGLAIWYAVWFSYPEKVGVFNLIINHISTATILIILWSVVGMLFLKTLTTAAVFTFVYGHLALFAFTGLIYYTLTVLIYYLIIYNSKLKERKTNEDKLLAMVKEAELNLLKSQINPHFLFNSLNSASSLTITNPAKAQDMIIKLSDFLRYSISRDSHQKSTLKLELENIQRYLDTEKVRFGNRIHYDPSICEECLNGTVPVMILQPLYENAIKHGVYESTEPITLRANCTIENNMLVFILSNNFDPEAPSKKGAGIGLKNIRERLRLTYQCEGLLQTSKTENTFEVKLMIPQ